jgi:hypothetical protein
VADVFNNQRVIEAEARELQARRVRAAAAPAPALTPLPCTPADAGRPVRQADGALDLDGHRL